VISNGPYQLGFDTFFDTKSIYFDIVRIET